MDVYTLLYFKWITSRDLLYSTGSSAQGYVAVWIGGGGWGRNSAYVWLSSFTVQPETITTLLIRCIWAVLMAQPAKDPPAMQETQETWVQSLDWEDSLEEENGNPLQYSCLKNAMDRGAWWATVQRVTKIQT